MIGVLINQSVGVRVHIVAVHELEMRSRNRVPEVADDRVDEEGFAHRVPVVAPGIRGALAHGFDDVAGGMIAPDAAVHPHTLGFRRAGPADTRGVGNADAAPKPAIRPPAEAVGEGVVVAAGDVKPIEQHLGFAVGNIVVIVIGDEQQARWAQQKHAAQANLDAGENLCLIIEHRAFIEMAVMVCVLKDQHAIRQVSVVSHFRLGVSVVLGDPKAPPRVKGHRDGLAHIRFAGEDGDRKAGRHFEAARGCGGRHRLAVGLGVVRFWKVLGGRRW